GRRRFSGLSGAGGQASRATGVSAASPTNGGARRLPWARVIDVRRVFSADRFATARRILRTLSMLRRSLNDTLISAVLPVYNEATVLAELFRRVRDAIEKSGAH